MGTVEPKPKHSGGDIALPGDCGTAAAFHPHLAFTYAVQPAKPPLAFDGRLLEPEMKIMQRVQAGAPLHAAAW